MEREREKIDFKPLTPGLGFHPFSDGLPYAPVSPKPLAKSMGAGATAAGTPKFASSIPRVNVPVARSVQPQPEILQSPLLNLESHYDFFYLLRRVFAYLVDTLINLSFAGASFTALLWNQNLQPELLENPGTIILSGIFFFAFSWALITAQEIAFGTTLGKRIFGLEIEGTVVAVFLRAFFFLPSICFLGVGLLWSLMDSKKRCWHDLIVNLQPTNTLQ